MVTDHKSILSSSQKSVVTLSTLLFDTHFLSEMSLYLEMSCCHSFLKPQISCLNVSLAPDANALAAELALKIYSDLEPKVMYDLSPRPCAAP